MIYSLLKSTQVLSKNIRLISRHRVGARRRLSANPWRALLSERCRRHSSHSSTDAADVRAARPKMQPSWTRCCGNQSWLGQWHEKVLGWKIQFPCRLPAPPKMYKQSWWISMLIDTMACISTACLTACGSVERIPASVSSAGLSCIAGWGVYCATLDAAYILFKYLLGWWSKDFIRVMRVSSSSVCPSTWSDDDTCLEVVNLSARRPEQQKKKKMPSRRRTSAENVGLSCS